jgi:hypothetical protein
MVRIDSTTIVASLGGFAIDVQFTTPPLPGELEFLAQFGHAPERERLFTIHVLASSNASTTETGTWVDATTCRTAWMDGHLLLDHEYFSIRIDTASRIASIRRSKNGWLALYYALRAGLGVFLPPIGALPIHGCGVLEPNGSLVFFGRSGAGKTTLASTSPYPLLSDELLIVERDGSLWTVQASGFWGGGRVEGNPASGKHPIRAMFRLDQTPRFSLRRLTPAEASRELVGTILVPPQGDLWAQTLALLDSLSATAPIYRMGWALGDPPWNHLASLFADDVGRDCPNLSDGSLE